MNNVTSSPPAVTVRNDRARRLRVTTALAATALVLAAAGCGDDSVQSSRSDTGGVPLTAAPAVTAPGRAGAIDDPSTEPGSPDGEVPVASNRALIVNASMAIETEDVDKAVHSATEIATTAGGLVTTADVQLQKPAIGRISLRVPPAQVETVLDSLSALGRVTSRGKGTEDVTAQVVDLESRIASARKSVERTREFLDKATKVSDLASLETDLAQRELVLEGLLSQQRSVDDLTSLATIEVTFTAPEAPGVVEPEPDDTEWPGPLDALRGGASALATLFLGIVIVLAALAPFLAVTALLWFVLRRPIRAAIRRMRRPAARPRPITGSPMPPPMPPGPAPTEVTEHV